MRKIILAVAMILSQKAAAAKFDIPGIGPVDIGPSSKEFTPEELLIDGYPIVIGTTATPSVEATKLIDIVCKALFHPRSSATRATRGWAIDDRLLFVALPKVDYIKDPAPARTYSKIYGFEWRFDMPATYSEEKVAVLKKLTCSKLF